MITLYHHPFCPHSRFVRLALAEFGIEPELVEERPWERRREFLLLNAEGATPVLVEESAPSVPGARRIAEYLDETRGPRLGDRRLLPEDPLGRRRGPPPDATGSTSSSSPRSSQLLVTEKIYKRFMSPRAGRRRARTWRRCAPARANIRYHLRYIGYLIGARNWLPGDRISYADLAAAAHLSCVDYLGDVPWDERRDGEDMVRADQVPPLVPLAAGAIGCRA